MSDIPVVTAEADREIKQPTLKSVGYDDLLDDIFGLNFRALSTVWDILVRPKNYFKAAKNPGWEEKYTPSFRLVLGLLAIFALFKIVYTNPESMIFQDFLQTELDYPTGPTDDVTREDIVARVGNQIYWMFLTVPIGLVFSWFSFSGLKRIWGQPLNFVVRLRYVFTLAVPLLIGVIASSLSELYVDSSHSAYLASQIFIVFAGFLLVGAVAYRGPLDKLPNPSKLFRAFLLTSILHLSALIGVTLAMGAVFLLV